MRIINLILFFSLFYFNVLGQYSGGNGSIGDPFVIANLDDLETLSNTSADWDSYFIQVADIDASPTMNWNNNQGFSPIGEEFDNFNGSYDGQNYVISNLFIDRPNANYIGLFGYAFNLNGASIANLTLEDVSITGEYRVGGLVGYNRGHQLVNCSVSGEVNGDDRVGGMIGEAFGSSLQNLSSTVSVIGNTEVGVLTGRIEGSTLTNSDTDGSALASEYYAGGLAGVIQGATITNCTTNSSAETVDGAGGLCGLLSSSTVTSCSAHGNASASGKSAAGFVAVMATSTVNQCYSTGDVSADEEAGGFVGYSYFNSTINNAYATGSVTGDDRVGGFSGFNQSGGTYNFAYSVGEVQGNSNVGGFIGENTGSVNNCFWDEVTSTMTTSDGGTGESTAEMQNQTTFTNASWDFVGESTNGTNDIWQMGSNCTNNGYPVFAWQTVFTGPVSAPTGDASQAFCGSATIEDIVVTGNSITWYDDQTAGDILSLSTVLVDGESYFASQTNGDCESTDRLEVVVSINTIPNAPTADTPQTFCGGATIEDLVVAGTAIQWYANAIGGLPLVNTSNLADNTSYFATQTVDGCESEDRAEVAVVITPLPDNSVTQVDFTLTADENNATYQWLDCTDNFEIISGETSASFTPVDNGEYAVEVTLNGCTDTSDCITISDLSITAFQQSSIHLFPNPSTGMFTLVSNLIDENYTVVDMQGRLVTAGKVAKTEEFIDICNMNKGTYFLLIKGKSYKLVKL